MRNDISRRAQAFALYEVGLSLERIREWTGLGRSTIFTIQDRALERGYNRISNKAFQVVIFRDAPRAGRPRLLGEEVRGKKFKSIIRNVTNTIIGALDGFLSHDATSRETPAEDLACKLGVSKRTVQRALRKLRFRKVKSTF